MVKLVDFHGLGRTWPHGLDLLHLFLCILALGFECGEVFHVFDAKVVVYDGFLVEIKAPNFWDFALRLWELFIVLANVKLLLNGKQMLNCVEIVLSIVEDATDIEDSYGTLVIVCLLSVAAAMVLK